MKRIFKELPKYPITIIFFVFLFSFSLLDAVFSSKKESELENRKLAQAPKFTIAAFIDNKWTKEFGEFTKDQFLLRDQWITTHSFLEIVQGKLEINNVWLANNNYQIYKNDLFKENQRRILPNNITAVSELAQRHPGKVSVMVVPSPATILSNKLRYNPPQIEEDALLDTMFTTLKSAGATTIDLREPFRQNANQQMYYFTDHHWTTRGGAWIAYEQFCQTKNITATPPDQSVLKEVPNFLGTNYAKTKSPFTQADTIEYYDLPNELTVFAFDKTGNLNAESGALMQHEKLKSFDKYSAFLRGNNGYSEIKGNGTGSILVFKDSYGNAFAPYLIENYEKIGIVDLRSWFSVDKTIAEGNYDEILVLYSFPSFTEDTNINLMMTDNQK